MDDRALKTTPLNRAHRAAGARMVAFAGWDMPVQYTGVLDEHMAVRTQAGLFDVSHMGEIEVRGAEAEALLQHVTSNDVSRLASGRIQYTALTTPEGTFVDDLLVYERGDADYLLVVNAGNAAKDFDWLRYHAKGFEVRVENVSDAYFQIALQGPKAEAILKPLTKAALPGIKYYAFERADVSGVPCLVSRTGYTGEDGFEIYGPAEAAEKVWYALLGSGAPHGLVPAGLAARDTLRLEAKMALYGNDIDETTSVLEADLGWILKLEKGEFLGREALVRQKGEGLARKLVGFETEGRAVARHGYPVLHEGSPVGSVTSGTFSPYLKKNIGLAYLPLALATPGTRFAIEIRGRAEPAVVVPTPFYKRAR
ncbi:MAG TPA: glycine cleavage system aminomethyltransferase GcvT [Candidatus Polarisedimenticolaceae bacterium]|nr:glycine cleavage system aminomethyltransferase GcvT [Candidatus Polarisedimenticolaceae bacterium]